jgi:hemoglobin-like flavoprotein
MITQSDFASLLLELSQRRAMLAQHPLYGALDTLPKVRRFMTCHAFAVWDFMALLKRLQRDLTCVEIPWRPRPDTALARLINEIVVGEESDVGVNGEPVSHFELYLSAMRAAGADAAPILRLSFGIAAGEPWQDVLARVAPNETVRQFVTATMNLAHHGQTHEVAAAFFFGRESVIPGMFRELSSKLQPQRGADLGPLVYYLDRHVEVDGDDHGPRAEKLLGRLIGVDPRRIQEARAVALSSLEHRAKLWSAILEDVSQPTLTNEPPSISFQAPELLQKSFLLFESKSEQLVEVFYQRLFAQYPTVATLFKGVKMDRQREMLLNALTGVIRYAEAPSSLWPVLSDLGSRHTRYGVKPEHYPLVGESLLGAMSELGGAEFTPAMRTAWAEAYGVISAVMLQGSASAPSRVAPQATPAE